MLSLNIYIFIYVLFNTWQQKIPVGNYPFAHMFFLQKIYTNCWYNFFVRVVCTNNGSVSDFPLIKFHINGCVALLRLPRFLRWSNIFMNWSQHKRIICHTHTPNTISLSTINHIHSFNHKICNLRININ
jgi:hypothetical protein